MIQSEVLNSMMQTYTACTGKEVRFEMHLERRIIQACVRDGKSLLKT